MGGDTGLGELREKDMMGVVFHAAEFEVSANS